MFIRRYTRGGVEYVCTAACDVRGPAIEEVKSVDPAEINCPSCLKLLKEVAERGRRS